jgi:hypothetical protein
MTPIADAVPADAAVNNKITIKYTPILITFTRFKPVGG